MSSTELRNKILGVLYPIWFTQQRIVGMDINKISENVGGDANRCFAAIQLLESDGRIQKSMSTWYRITPLGLDECESSLPPSAVSKRQEQRKIVLLKLKELYLKNVLEYMRNNVLAEKTGITDFFELSGIVYYLEYYGLIEIVAWGGGFQTRLTAVGSKALEEYVFDSSRAMSRAYTLLFKLENQLRRFVEQKMLETYGSNWWNNQVPQGVRNKADEFSEEEKKIGWSVSDTKGLMDYTLFAQLKNIIIARWDDVFKGYFKDQDWINLRLTELEGMRNAIAHTRTLTIEGMTRLQSYYDDIMAITRGLK